MTYGRRPPLVIWWHMNDQTYLFSMFVYYCIWSQLTSDHHYLSLTRNIYLWNRVTNTITITITITIIISTCDTVSVMTIGFWRTSKAMSLVRALAEYSGWMKILKYLYLFLCFFYILYICYWTQLHNAWTSILQICCWSSPQIHQSVNVLSPYWSKWNGKFDYSIREYGTREVGTIYKNWKCI